jgi:hypothetical protein
VETLPLHGRVFHLRVYVVLLLQGTRLAAHRHARARCLYAAQPLRADHVDAASRLTDGDATPPPGAPFELEELWAELERHGAERHALARSIDRRLAECVDACRARLGNVDALAANPCFQLLGADVILGRELEPYVVEINKMPSLRPRNAADAALKHAVLADTFALAGLLGPQRASGLVALPLRAA